MRNDRRPEHRRHGGGAPSPSPRTDIGPTPGDRVRIFGLHAVAAALANPDRRHHRLYVTETAEPRFAAAITARGLAPERVQPKDLDRRLGPDTVHQGALLETGPLPERDVTELGLRARTHGPLIVLDQVTDPHNVGAILRSAAVFDAAGLLMTRRHSPELSGALAKAASGALELVPVALVTNLARAMEQLAELGLTRVGLDGEAETLIEAADLSGPVALVLGSEGRGLRRLTRESCDQLVRIGAPGAIASLNVSNAAAVAMHAASLQRRR
ncbi:MAG: 23S rRNA (guanosine(2251)-2'-O)-methyltransferase RlmB [Hyphomicrobiaceae bacterium]